MRQCSNKPSVPFGALANYDNKSTICLCGCLFVLLFDGGMQAGVVQAVCGWTNGHWRGSQQRLAVLCQLQCREVLADHKRVICVRDVAA